jgi:hypothetical protein
MREDNSSLRLDRDSGKDCWLGLDSFVLVETRFHVLAGGPRYRGLDPSTLPGESEFSNSAQLLSEVESDSLLLNFP